MLKELEVNKLMKKNNGPGKSFMLTEFMCVKMSIMTSIKFQRDSVSYCDEGMAGLGVCLQ